MIPVRQCGFASKLRRNPLGRGYVGRAGRYRPALLRVVEPTGEPSAVAVRLAAALKDRCHSVASRHPI